MGEAELLVGLQERIQELRREIDVLNAVIDTRDDRIRDDQETIARLEQELKLQSGSLGLVEQQLDVQASLRKGLSAELERQVNVLVERETFFDHAVQSWKAEVADLHHQLDEVTDLLHRTEQLYLDSQRALHKTEQWCCIQEGDTPMKNPKQALKDAAAMAREMHRLYPFTRIVSSAARRAANADWCVSRIAQLEEENSILDSERNALHHRLDNLKRPDERWSGLKGALSD